MPPFNRPPAHVDDESRMAFIETTRYQRFTTTNGASSHPVPPGWEQFKHPNSDIYYYHRILRLITPDDIRDTDKLRFVLEAREDHLQCLNGSVAQLPDDWELVLSDVTDTVAVIGMFSRRVGIEYEWTEERGKFHLRPFLPRSVPLNISYRLANETFSGILLVTRR
ncbi:hypothetical protein C0991_000666 [Blastosporella zonata]|nr:hypothetical protein C0991_000666 [Blastosporella zonata]